MEEVRSQELRSKITVFYNTKIIFNESIGPSKCSREDVHIYPHIARQLIFREGKCINAYDIISSVETLKMAYEMIKSNPGNMTRGTDEETLDGISNSWFERASDELERETYKMRPGRRVYIPKANGKMRPLGISSPRDKIVQQAMKMVLDCILEPKFLGSSHGFRPHRSTHTALREVRH